MLLILPFVALASLLGSIRGGNIIYRLMRLWSVTWFFLVGIRHRNEYLARPDPKGHYIFVLNHISYLDAALAVNSIRQPFRALGKAEMASLPLFGFIYRSCVVMVDRKDPANRARSLSRMKAILRKGISIMIFPEGTFNETGRPLKDFYDGAFRIAIETQTPVMPVVFLDAYQRMHHRHMLSLEPGMSRAVFLEPVSVVGLSSDDIGMLRQKVYGIMEAYLISHSDLY
jgi:1-acyl-sn-glycerol-3-phosphate acyltransferase